MTSLLKDKLFIVLLVLLGLTLLSWLSVSFFSLDAQTLGTLMLVLAFIKARLIIIHYMEASKVALLVRLAFEAWVMLVGGVTVLLYLGVST